jgi:eukaryotic-like serine/threonine-protein kinase
MPTALRIPAWTRIALLFGCVKLGAVVAAFSLLHRALPADHPFGPPAPFDYLQLAAYGIAAIFLVVAGHSDARAVWLGGFFLFMADGFCDPLTAQLILHGSGALADVGYSFDSMRLDILMPLFLWKFVHDFPQPPTTMRLRRLVDLGLRTSGVAALALLTFYLVNAVLLAIAGQASSPAAGGNPAVTGVTAVTASVAGAAAEALRALPEKPLNSLFGAIEYLLIALALPVLAYKARLATGEGRRRARVFVNSLLLGLAPVTAYWLCAVVIRGYLPYMQQHPEVSRPLTITASLFALGIPLSTIYLVLVQRVLDVRLTARRALQYALARGSVVALATVPLAVVVLYFYEHRGQSLSELFSASQAPVVLLAVAALGMAALSYRDGLLDWIDRRFFREQYDARRILSMLIERVRAIREGADLAKVISREVDFALHLASSTMLTLEPRTGMLKDPNDRTRRLDGSSPLAVLVSSGSEPLTVDLADPRSPVVRLPEKDRQWLTESRFRLLVPILARDGSLLGIMCLGDKKSGLPFLKEDRQLLHAIASSAAWVLELEHSRTATPRTSGTRIPALETLLPSEPLPVTEVAKECMACGTLYQPYTVFCGTCSRRLDAAHVPFVLPGRFRFERRIGAGGMGVVYSGADLALGRPVAVKTLRRVSPDDAMRLRREARTAAAVSHPHLASIYGIETWQGTPMLILELLDGGTLADRIERQRLTPAATLDLGIAIAEALAHLHSADILHRDVKPSNIGFNRDGMPKLMDFGIARVMFDLRRDGRVEDVGTPDDDASSFLRPTSILDQTATSLDLSRQFAGTLSYLSPEALNGQRADASFDLWSLAIVLYECLLGRKVFTGGDVRQITSRIRLGRVPDFAQVCPEYDSALADFFRRALHRTVARRPASALELKQMLTEARRKLAV